LSRQGAPECSCKGIFSSKKFRNHPYLIKPFKRFQFWIFRKAQQADPCILF